ncbi:hypothetical protein DF186_25475, partial [Enterococcus hirae]
GQLVAQRQLEQPVLLVVVDVALRAGEHRVVVGSDGDPGGLGPDAVGVDGGRAGDQPVRGGGPLQVLEVATTALGGDP